MSAEEWNADKDNDYGFTVGDMLCHVVAHKGAINRDHEIRNRIIADHAAALRAAGECCELARESGFWHNRTCINHKPSEYEAVRVAEAKLEQTAEALRLAALALERIAGLERQDFCLNGDDLAVIQTTLAHPAIASLRAGSESEP